MSENSTELLKRNLSKFGFGKKDETKRSDTEIAIESVQDKHDATLEKAKLLLHSEPCKDLLAQYQVAERATIDAMLRCAKEEFDTTKFGGQIRVLLLQLINIRALINIVHTKAGEEYTGV